jgi:hypothetical protein
MRRSPRARATRPDGRRSGLSVSRISAMGWSSWREQLLARIADGRGQVTVQR